MKKNLFVMLLAFIVFLTGCVTNESLTPEENTYSAVIEMPGLSSDRLFILSNDWLVSIFRSAEAVVEYSDRSEGIIIGKANADIYMGGIGKAAVDFKITINIKDDRVRIKFDDMKYSRTSSALANAIMSFGKNDYDRFVIWAEETVVRHFENHLKTNTIDEW